MASIPNIATADARPMLKILSLLLVLVLRDVPCKICVKEGSKHRLSNMFYRGSVARLAHINPHMEIQMLAETINTWDGETLDCTSADCS